MRPLLLTLLTLAVTPVAAQTDAPWAGRTGEACLEGWMERAVDSMNSYTGDAAFNRRKPWRIDEFGRLRGAGDPSDYPPENYGRYNEDRPRFMWDYYEYALRRPGGGWLMPEMDAAGVPQLRQFVEACQERVGPSPSPPKPRTFFEPMVGDYRVDWCLHWASGCGGPAADRFCRDQGFQGAGLWEIAIDVAAQTPTYILGDDRVCTLPSCDGFQFISCLNDLPADGSSALEVGFQRFGADYRVFTPAAAVAEACQTACLAEPRCQAWTFEQSDGGGARCRLKHSVTPPTPDACCTSGVRKW